MEEERGAVKKEKMMRKEVWRKTKRNEEEEGSEE